MDAVNKCPGGMVEHPLGTGPGVLEVFLEVGKHPIFWETAIWIYKIAIQVCISFILGASIKVFEFIYHFLYVYNQCVANSSFLAAFINFPYCISYIRFKVNDRK